MAGNRGVVFLGPGNVEVRSIDYPRMVNPQGKQIEHAVILRTATTNICGSDQHMVRGRTTAPKGLVLGHEITGEIVEKGKDVEFLEVGDMVSVPFNVACGRCRNCREQQTGICLNVNSSRPGGAYGYVDMGGWTGGQAQYVMVPYADFNLLKFPDRQQALEKILDLTMLSDILPTGFHGAVTAGVGVGSTVYIAGAGPVGLAAAASAQILGAAVVMIGDVNPQRLKHARAVGFEAIDLTKSDKLEDLIEAVVGVPEVDAAVDAVGFEAHGHGRQAGAEAPATVLNSIDGDYARGRSARAFRGSTSPKIPERKEPAAQHGTLGMRFGLGWAKSLRFSTGQTPVLKYNRQLMQAILHDRLPIAKIVNASVISLDEAARGYHDFDTGAAKKFVIDPNGMVKKAA